LTGLGLDATPEAIRERLIHQGDKRAEEEEDQRGRKGFRRNKTEEGADEEDMHVDTESDGDGNYECPKFVQGIFDGRVA
jgi:hypothetical protein